MAVAEVTQAKAEWRARLLARRTAREPSEVRAAGEAIAPAAISLCEGAGTVAAYLSMPSEPQTGPLITALQDAGIRVLLPVIDGDHLDWVEDAGERRTGRFGVPEPVGPRLGPTALSEASVVLVPALAADRRGVRLGRGRGYYDRALAAGSSTGSHIGLLVAVVYDDELVDALPAEDHDVRMGAALSPSGWGRFTEPAGQ